MFIVISFNINFVHHKVLLILFIYYCHHIICSVYCLHVYIPNGQKNVLTLTRMFVLVFLLSKKECYNLDMPYYNYACLATLILLFH